MRFLTCSLLAFALPAGASAHSLDEWEELSAQDLRLATVADKLLSANAELCTDTMPLTGMVLHSRDQYGADDLVDSQFTNGPLAISSIIPGSPADAGGLAVGDGISAINGIRITDLDISEHAHLREAAFDLLSSWDGISPVSVLIARGDTRQTISLDPKAGCKSLVEITTGTGPTAQSDGRVIQVNFDFAKRVDDQQLAVVLAHELAHTVLHHRRRKVDAGVSGGILGPFGRNQQANRQAEVEADRLSPHLLSNAGYEAILAANFWRSDIGRSLGGGMMSGFVYPTQGARAELIENEIARYLPRARGPTWPGHLLVFRDLGF